MSNQQNEKPLGKFAGNLLPEIETDQGFLRKIADQAGVGSTTIKELGARLEEKISRLKLRDLEEAALILLERGGVIEQISHGRVKGIRAEIVRRVRYGERTTES